MRQRSARNARARTPAGRGDVDGEVSRFVIRYNSARTPPASDTAATKVKIELAGIPIAAAPISFTSPPPIQPRRQQNAETMKTPIAAAKGPGRRPFAALVATPAIATPSTKPFGIVRVAT